MQKTLTVKKVGDATKNVLSFTFFIGAAQTLFLGLGVLIYLYVARQGIGLTVREGQVLQTDELYPMLTLNFFWRNRRGRFPDRRHRLDVRQYRRLYNGTHNGIQL